MELHQKIRVDCFPADIKPFRSSIDFKEGWVLSEIPRDPFPIEAKEPPVHQCSYNLPYRYDLTPYFSVNVNLLTMKNVESVRENK
jgi:hypothetical protein